MTSERITRTFRPLSKFIFMTLIFIALIMHVAIVVFPDFVAELIEELNRIFEGLPLFRGLFIDWQTTLLIVFITTIGILEGLSLLLVDNKSALIEPELIEEYAKIDVIKSTNLVLIPAYNEAETIVDAINVAKNAGEVLVIDDGSEDNTLSLAREYATHVISHAKNHGLAQGIMNGIDFALNKGYNTMVIFDADLQYTQKDLVNVVKVLQNSKYDIVMGSRLEGSIEKMKFTKKFGNWIFSKALSYITEIPISDGQTGLRAFTDVFASNINFRGQFTYTQEMLFETARNDFSLGEIPIEFKERVSGESRLMTGAIDYAIRAWNLNLQIIAEYNPIKFSLGTMAILIIFSFFTLNKRFDFPQVSILLLVGVYLIMFLIGIYASILINRLQMVSSKKKYKIMK